MGADQDVVLSAECSECKDLEAEFSKGSGKPKLTRRGKVILIVAGTTFGLVSAITTPFLIPALRKVCLPYVPATTKQVDNVMHLLEGKQGRLIDLGSGDGRIVIEAAKRGFRADGVELNPWLVWFSRLSSLRCGTHSRTSFHRRDLWKTDLSKYDHIVIFGVDSMMSDLADKLKQDLCNGCHVIACRFPLPGLKPENTVGCGIDTVWLYTKKSWK